MPRRLVFPWLDGLRAFAALSVLVYHFVAHWDWETFPTSGPLAWFRGGWMAVDVFFVISGCVVGLSAFSRIDAQGSAFRRGFLRSRLARIVPLHYLLLAVFVLAVQPALLREDDFWWNLGSHLLFVHNLFFDWYGAINGPNWSLGAEMQFYLLVALAAPWLRTMAPWRIAVTGLLVAWAWRFGTHAAWQPGPVDLAYMAQTQLPGMLDAFAMGLLLARFVRTSFGQQVLACLAGSARLRWGLAVLAALSWWGLLALQLTYDYWEEPAMAVFFRTGLAAGAGLVLLLLCGLPVRQGSPLAAGAAYLGKLSYGIYLWHLPVLILLGEHTALEPLPALFVALATTLACAALSWHLVEEPLLRRFGQAPQGRAALGGTARPWRRESR